MSLKSLEEMLTISFSATCLQHTELDWSFSDFWNVNSTTELAQIGEGLGFIIPESISHQLGDAWGEGYNLHRLPLAKGNSQEKSLAMYSFQPTVHSPGK